MKYFLVVCYELIVKLIFWSPRFRIFNWVKSNFLRLMGANIGKRVIFYPGVWIAPGFNLKIGDDVDLALDVILTTSGGVAIGNRVLVGYRTQILSANHRIPNDKKRIFDSGHEKAMVVIKDDAWIGANCIILPGVTIGEGAVIAAGSVVTKDIPDYVIAAGVPCRVIRERT